MFGPMTMIEEESSLSDLYWDCEKVWCNVAIKDEAEIATGEEVRGGASMVEVEQCRVDGYTERKREVDDLGRRVEEKKKKKKKKKYRK